jgi:hypothetical protein
VIGKSNNFQKTRTVSQKRAFKEEIEGRDGGTHGDREAEVLKMPKVLTHR